METHGSSVERLFLSDGLDQYAKALTGGGMKLRDHVKGRGAA